MTAPQRPALTGAQLVEHHTVSTAVVGSRAYGLDGADSDVDVRGAYQAPTSRCCAPVSCGSTSGRTVSGCACCCDATVTSSSDCCRRWS